MYLYLQPPVPTTDGLDPLSLLTDDAQIAVWNNEGLPSDRMSTENATILTNSERWPLMIDPQVDDQISRLPKIVFFFCKILHRKYLFMQLQGVKWIKQKYGEGLVVIRLGQKGMLDHLEQGITNGSVVMLENIGEVLDPVLDPLLTRNLIKKGRCVPITVD